MVVLKFSRNYCKKTTLGNVNYPLWYKIIYSVAYHSWFRYVWYGRESCIVTDGILWNTRLVS